VWGGRLLVDAKALTVGASVLGGSSDVAAGMLNATLLHGFLAFSPLRVRSDAAWLLAAGPRAGLGVLNVEATPAETVTGSSAIEAYFDAAAFALVERQLAGDFALRATFEVGYARGMVALADGEAAGRYAGVFAGGHVALCFAP
jgi:hypothetical protein